MNEDENRAEYVTLKFGDHEITMTTEEADRLTDEDRARLGAQLAGTDESVAASYRAEAATRDRARAAARGSGDLLVIGLCTECKGRKARQIAEARQFSGGVVFIGHGPAHHRLRQLSVLRDRFRSRGWTRSAGPPMLQEKCLAILTESPTPALSATCPVHGTADNIDPTAVLQLALSAEPGWPRKMKITPGGSTA